MSTCCVCWSIFVSCMINLIFVCMLRSLSWLSGRIFCTGRFVCVLLSLSWLSEWQDLLHREICVCALISQLVEWVTGSSAQGDLWVCSVLSADWVSERIFFTGRFVHVLRSLSWLSGRIFCTGRFVHPMPSPHKIVGSPNPCCRYTPLSLGSRSITEESLSGLLLGQGFLSSSSMWMALKLRIQDEN